MTPARNLAEPNHLDAELLSAIAVALASGTHRDHELLLIHQRLLEAERVGAVTDVGFDDSDASDDSMEAHRRRVLRSLVCMPAHTPLGIAAKLAVACAMSGVFEAAQEAPDGPVAPHVILSVFLDAMTQARLLPSERPSLSQ
ncbi:hypothetical protein [Azospirillum sp. sgz302134]